MVHAVTFAPGSNLLASAGRDWAVRLWDSTTGKEVRSITGPRGWLDSLAFAPRGKLLAAGGDARDPHVFLFDPATGREVRRLGATRGSSQPLPSHRTDRRSPRPGMMRW